MEGLIDTNTSDNPDRCIENSDTDLKDDVKNCISSRKTILDMLTNISDALIKIPESKYGNALKAVLKAHAVERLNLGTKQKIKHTLDVIKAIEADNIIPPDTIDKLVLAEMASDFNAVHHKHDDVNAPRVFEKVSNNNAAASEITENDSKCANTKTDLNINNSNKAFKAIKIIRRNNLQMFKIDTTRLTRIIDREIESISKLYNVNRIKCRNTKFSNKIGPYFENLEKGLTEMETTEESTKIGHVSSIEHKDIDFSSIITASYLQDLEKDLKQIQSIQTSTNVDKKNNVTTNEIQIKNITSKVESKASTDTNTKTKVDKKSNKKLNIKAQENSVTKPKPKTALNDKSETKINVAIHIKGSETVIKRRKRKHTKNMKQSAAVAELKCNSDSNIKEPITNKCDIDDTVKKTTQKFESTQTKTEENTDKAEISAADYINTMFDNSAEFILDTNLILLNTTEEGCFKNCNETADKMQFKFSFGNKHISTSETSDRQPEIGAQQNLTQKLLNMRKTRLQQLSVAQNKRQQQPVENNTQQQQPVENNLQRQQQVENTQGQQPVENNIQQQQQPVENNTRQQQSVESDTQQQQPVENNIQQQQMLENNTHQPNITLNAPKSPITQKQPNADMLWRSKKYNPNPTITGNIANSHLDTAKADCTAWRQPNLGHVESKNYQQHTLDNKIHKPQLDATQRDLITQLELNYLAQQQILSAELVALQQQNVRYFAQQRTEDYVNRSADYFLSEINAGNENYVSQQQQHLANTNYNAEFQQYAGIAADNNNFAQGSANFTNIDYPSQQHISNQQQQNSENVTCPQSIWGSSAFYILPTDSFVPSPRNYQSWSSPKPTYIPQQNTIHDSVPQHYTMQPNYEQQQNKQRANFNATNINQEEQDYYIDIKPTDQEDQRPSDYMGVNHLHQKDQYLQQNIVRDMLYLQEDVTDPPTPNMNFHQTFFQNLNGLQSLNMSQSTPEADQSSQQNYEPADTENNFPTCIHCVFCKNNGETTAIYNSHKLKDANGHITCPVLKRHYCEICGSTGIFAHTMKYCPFYRCMLSRSPTGRL